MKKKKQHTPREKQAPAAPSPTRLVREKTQLVLLNCPKALAEELDDICELNLMRRSQVVNLAVKNFMERLSEQTQELLGPIEEAPLPDEEAAPNAHKFISGAEPYLFVRAKEDELKEAPKPRRGRPPRASNGLAILPQ